MYAYALEQEGLPCSWPSFPSAQPLMSTPSLSPALPGAVSVRVGGVMEQGRKPVEEERENEQLIPGSYSVFTAVLLASACRG